MGATGNRVGASRSLAGSNPALSASNLPLSLFDPVPSQIFSCGSNWRMQHLQDTGATFHVDNLILVIVSCRLGTEITIRAPSETPTQTKHDFDTRPMINLWLF